MNLSPIAWRRLFPALGLAAGLLAPWAAHAAAPRMAIGADFVVVSRTDGTVWAWGLGNDGQLAMAPARPAAGRCG